jgi:N-acetylmuramoyl-L-alanine amidase
MKILLICGHGEGDPGAVGNGFKEADLVREIIPKLKGLLSPYAEVDVFDTTKNMYKYLKAGNSFNFKKYDYVFELHFNAGVNDKSGNKKTTGTEILVHPNEKGISVEETILKKIEKLGFKNRGVKRRTNLLNMNTCKGKQGVSYALFEVCFIDDLDDITLYQAKKNDIIKAITEGIVEGFKLNKSVNNSMNKVEPSEQLLVSADDITKELNHSFFPITDMEKFSKELNEAKEKNSSLYWGFYKLVNKIK